MPGERDPSHAEPAAEPSNGSFSGVPNDWSGWLGVGRKRVISTWIVPLLILAAGSGLSLLAFESVVGKVRIRALADLAAAASDEAAAVEQRLTSMAQAAVAVAAFQDSSIEVDEQEFDQFAEEICKSLRGLVNLQWVDRIRGSDRAAWEARHGITIKKATDDGTLVPAPNADEYAAVWRAYPAERDRAIFGRDMLSSPERAEAIVRAIQTGDAAMTAPVRLARFQGMIHGVLIIVPAQIQRRAGEHRGMAVAVVNLEGLFMRARRLGPAADDEEASVTMRVLDRTNPGEVQVWSDGPPLHGEAIQYVETISKGGRFWELTWSMPMPAAPVYAWAILVVGVVGSGLLSLLVVSALGRTRAERARIGSEIRLHDALAAARMITWEWDTKTQRGAYSQEPGEFFGLPHVGRVVTAEQGASFIHPDDRPRVRRELREAIEQDQEVLTEHRGAAPRNGADTWYAIRGRTLKDSHGRVAGLLGITMDITDRVLAEQRIRTSEERLRLVASATFDAVYDWDIPNDRLLWTPGMERLFGHSVEAMGTTVKQWAARLHPADADATNASLAGALEGDASEWTAEYRFRRADDFYAHVYERGVIIRDDTGRAVRMVGAMTDVTGEWEAREELESLNRTLERRVAERTAELAVKNRELEAFAYSVSHDLRAPLRAIDGFSLALQEDYRDRLDEQGRQWLDRVRGATVRMGQLIDDLLLLSRVSRGELTRTEIDITDLAQRTVLSLRRTDPQRAVDVDIQPGMTAVGDPRLARIILENLIGNAWKFTARRERAAISVTMKRGESGPVFSIKDNGAGFDPRYADKLFGVFQRLHTVEEFPGTGIGLATVNRIVQRHGGWVRGVGEIDRGAEFLFTLAPGVVDNANEADPSR